MHHSKIRTDGDLLIGLYESILGSRQDVKGDGKMHSSDSMGDNSLLL